LRGGEGHGGECTRRGRRFSPSPRASHQRLRLERRGLRSDIGARDRARGEDEACGEAPNARAFDRAMHDRSLAESKVDVKFSAGKRIGI
jgi:hypothetical protein